MTPVHFLPSCLFESRFSIILLRRLLFPPRRLYCLKVFTSKHSTSFHSALCKVRPTHLIVLSFITLCRGEPQTRTHGLGSRFWFHVKPAFPSLPTNYYLFLRRIPYRSLWSYPRNRPLVNSWENQSLAAATIPQRFWHSICSELKYVECTYVLKHEQELVNKVFMLYVFQCHIWLIITL